MEIPKDKLENYLKNMLSIIKPEGVVKIDFELDRIRKDVYYLTLIYVVPDDSPYMKVNRKEDPRYDWNRSIVYSIRDYLNIHVIINQFGFSTESHYKQQKQREKEWQRN